MNRYLHTFLRVSTTRYYTVWNMISVTAIGALLGYILGSWAQ